LGDCNPVLVQVSVQALGDGNANATLGDTGDTTGATCGRGSVHEDTRILQSKAGKTARERGDTRILKLVRAQPILNIKQVFKSLD
jgi:hypothetical protein